MNITAIIAEYNPLHNGHVHHIDMCKKTTSCDALICIMSGNFVQRGVPAIIDKYNRTRMALNSGIDLVIELPVLYSLSSAEFFSFGAVSLINSLNVVNNLCFGSECGDINTLYSIAYILSKEPEQYKKGLKSYLNFGYTYPVSRSNALLDYVNSIENKLNISNLDTVISSSNNILGIEYIKSLLKLNSTISPITITREGSQYNSLSLEQKYSSASAIRNHIKTTDNFLQLKNQVPPHVMELIYLLKNNNYHFTYESNMFNFIKYKHFNCSSTLENIPDVSEGLNNRIYKCIENSHSYDELVSKIKSKRYTFTRINRILAQYFIGFDSYDTKHLRTQPCPYARILGFNKRGLDVLKEIKINGTIPLISKMPKNCNEILSLELQSTKAYSLLNSSINWNDDYLISPINIR